MEPGEMTVVSRIADHVVGLSATPLKVAVDGVDGVGKTTFANQLGEALSSRGRSVIRSSVDGFHNPRAVRYRLGESSPQGFYRDSYDYTLLQQELIRPLSHGGSRRFRSIAFDHRSDSPVHAEEQVAPRHAVLLFDGLFLHRPELRRHWDFSVFLDAPFEITVPRGAGRGTGFGNPDMTAPSNRRYVEGNKIYFAECDPKATATVVVDYSDFHHPQIISWRT